MFYTFRAMWTANEFMTRIHDIQTKVIELDSNEELGWGFNVTQLPIEVLSKRVVDFEIMDDIVVLNEE